MGDKCEQTKRSTFWTLDEHYNYCLRAVLLLGPDLVLYFLRASSSGLLYCLRAVSFALLGSAL